MSSVAEIQNKRDNLLKSWNNFKKAASSRGSKLDSAKRMEEFQRNADEIEQWIEDKLKISTDESYKDPANMQVCVLLLCLTFSGQDQEAPGVRGGDPSQ